MTWLLAELPAVVPALKPDAVLGFVLLDITLIVSAALALGSLARRLGQPTVVGQIVAGVLLGPTLLGPTLFTWGDSWGFLHCDVALAATNGVPSIGSCVFPPQARSIIGVIGQVALVLYMFLVGTELDLDALRGKGRAIGTVAIGAVAVPLALGVAIGPMLYDAKWVAGFGADGQPSKLAFSLMVGSMLAVTALPVMAHILQEKGLSRSLMGSVGIAAAACVSVLMFLAVATSVAVARHDPIGDILVKVALTALFIAVLVGVVRPLLVPLGRTVEQQGTLTQGTFAVIIILVFASSFVADRIGINVIPGAFLAGAVLPAREIIFREMSARLRDLTLVVLLPIFLAYSGLNTDFTSLGTSFLGGIALFLAAGVAGKWLGGAVSARIGGMSWAEGNLLGVLMNCRGLLVLVVALSAVQANVISPALQTAAVVMALITTAMTGPLFDALLPRAVAVGEPAPNA